MNDQKELFWRTSLNLLIKVAAQILNLAVIPLYVKYLDLDEFGIVNLGNVLLLFIVLFSGLGLNDSLIRFFTKVKNSRLKNSLFSAIIFTVSVTTIFLLIILLVFDQSLSALFFNDSTQYRFFDLLLLTTMFEAWNVVIIMLLHSEKKNVLFGVAALSRNSVKLVLTFILLHYFDLNIYGAFWGIYAGQVVVILICLPLILKRLTFHIPKNVFKIVLNYGLPFVLTGLAMQLLFQVDQVLLKFIIGLEAVAIYGLSYKIGSAIQYLNSSFSLAWFPILYEKNHQKAKESIPEVLEYYLVFIMIIGVILTIANNYFLLYFLPDAYVDALFIIPWILWGYIIFGLSDFVGAGLYIRYKSKTYSAISGIAAVLNIVLNLVFISMYGIKAAAVVTFISFVLFIVLIFIKAQNHFFIKYDYRKYLKIIGLFSLILATSFFHIFSKDISRISFALILIVLSLAFPFIFKLLKFEQLKSLFSIKAIQTIVKK